MSTSANDIKTNVWTRFCDRVIYFAPEVIEAVCIEDDVIHDICDIAANDMSDNEIPYEDMIYFCVKRVNSRGYEHVSSNTILPSFPYFDSDLKYRANYVVSKYDDYEVLETSDIIHVVQDIVDYYLVWCKRIIFEFWSDEDIEFFNDCLDETNAESIEYLQIPMLFPVEDGVEIRNMWIRI